MTPKIHADPPKFHQVAEDLRRIAEELRQGGGKLLSATADARSYDGQYAPWVQSIASDGDHRTRNLSEKIASLAHTLDRIAQAFEDADRLDHTGFSHLADQFRVVIESGYDTSSFPLWLIRGQCPPWIKQELWNRLPLDDRDAILSSVGEDWLGFAKSGDYSHGTDQDIWNAFTVYLFMQGILGEPPELEVWKSAAKAAGMSLEDYVMKILDITPYDRDTVGGAGITETRQIGPIAVLMVGQALINTTRSYELKGVEYYGFKKYANDIDRASDRFAGWGEGYKNKDQAEYLHLALNGESNQNRYNPYTGEKLGEGEDDMLAPLASAAQDGAWRLLAGYNIGDPTFFLLDESSEWWCYYQSTVEEGYVYPLTMNETMNMIEKSYFYNNEYEGNPSLISLETERVEITQSIDPFTGEIRTVEIHHSWYEEQLRANGYDLAAESLIEIPGMKNKAFVSHTDIGPVWSKKP